MKKKKKILVLTDHMPWGHRSIAKAIFNYLKDNEEGNGFEVMYEEVKSEAGIGNDIYTFFYRYYPAINRFNNKMLASKIGLEVLKEGATRNLKRLKKVIKRLDPDLIISAYFFHSHSLAQWRRDKNKKYKLWTVAADPRSISPISFVKDVDLHLVYDKEVSVVAQKCGISKDDILETGWWVRSEMYKEYDKEKIRKVLGFNDDRPIVFVGGGSLGTSALPKILPLLMLIRTKVGFIFNTGTDKLSFNLVEEYIKLFKKLRKDDLVQIKNLGWIENMAEVLGASDIVFGKAGPNFLFDVVAAEKPFVAITHIGGQEDGNIELIKEKEIGWVKEKNRELAKFLFEYLGNTKFYNQKYLENIKKEGQLNKKSLPLVLEMVKKELNLIK